MKRSQASPSACRSKALPELKKYRCEWRSTVSAPKLIRVSFQVSISARNRVASESVLLTPSWHRTRSQPNFGPKSGCERVRCQEGVSKTVAKRLSKLHVIRNGL